jgi:serine phosphatase RsbU (regulator of sigma subunit)/CHASE2 domain-containing sensor protein
LRLTASGVRSCLRRLLPLLYLIPLAYVVRPIFWAPLDDRFYNYFHAKRAVAPWTEVVVVGVDRPTREETLVPPVFPLSRHQAMHAQVARNLDRAGARTIVFDLALGEKIFAEPPGILADAFRATGKVHIVMSLREERRTAETGETAVRVSPRLPDPLLMESALGAFIADVRTDSDGVVRRFIRDERGERLGIETLPERLAGVRAARTVPIEFPSRDRPIPTVSYRDVLAGDPDALAQVEGKIAFIGLIDDPSTDFVSVPRLQDLGDGVEAFGLPGVVVLAAITETLIRGSPIRDAGWLITFLWNVFWCALCVILIRRRSPTIAALSVAATVVVALAATGAFHVAADLVFPAGLLFGCLFLAGSHGLIMSYVETAKELHTEALENERVRQEMAMAREAQERFLPDTIPSVEGIDVWGTNVSSLTVSGDYFDVVDLGNERPLIIAIADVSGKGLPASLVMSNVQAGLHSHLFHEEFDIAKAARDLNRLVHQNTDPGKFVTFFVAEVDKTTHRLRYVRAGHDEPIVVSADGSDRKLEEGDFVLGFVPDADFQVGEIDLAPGDVLCLYTDGVTEARNPQDEEFELDRIIETVRDHRTETAEEIGRAIIVRVREFSQLKQQADDVTLVLLKIRADG